MRNEFGEKSEAYKPKSMLNPYYQHWCSCLAHRALHPDEKLPEVSEDVKKLLQSPFENKPSYKLALDQIRKHFPIIEIETKPTRKLASKFFKVDDANEAQQGPSGVNLNDVKMTDLVQPTILEVSTLHPVRDFKALLEKGEPLDKLCPQMNRAITQTIVWSVGKDSFDKAEAALRELRRACVLKNPSLYNDWIPKLRMDLFERGRGEFFDIVVKGNLGLITSNENASSSVTDDDARKFLEYEEAKEEAPIEEDMDEDDLLNEI
ncbi:hypothetical protein C0J52_04076 [Blattella germanica]|nr:hypothetical protein C0J52_04076 [Blattella germanica]